LTGRLPRRIAPCGEGRVQIRQQLARDRLQVLALRNRGEMRKPDGLAAAFHAPFVVSLTDAGEVGFEQVVADQRQEPAAELAPGADNLAYRRREIVVLMCPSRLCCAL